MPGNPATSRLRTPLELRSREVTNKKRRSANVIFSPKRQSWVRSYKEMAWELPALYGRRGSTQWIQKLLQYLQNYQAADIQLQDLNRWMGKYPWIIQEIEGVPLAGAFQPDSVPDDSAQIGSAVRVDPPQNQNLPSSSTGGVRGNQQQIPGETPKKELLKRYDAIRDQIVELQDMIADLPEFRAAIPALDFLARVVGRNYRHVVSSNKRREEVLHEDLAREGIPHIEKGVKRERFQVPKELESDSDVEVVSVLV